MESPRKRLSSSSGAVRRRLWSWLAACVLALIAERRAERKVLIISTLAVGALGHARGFSGQNRPRGGFGVGGVGLLEVAARASPPTLGALHLKHLDPLSPQVSGESGPVGAGAFYTGAPDGAEALSPA